jgi:hypothetical protein
MQNALGSASAVLGDWHVPTIYEPRVASTKVVYLVTGSAVDADIRIPFALVLKVLTAPVDGTEPLELQLYQSGFPASLNGGLVATQCFGTAELPGGCLGLARCYGT